MLARRDTQREVSRLRPLSPLQTLEDQSRTWGIRCHSCTGREGFAPSWKLAYKTYVLRFTRESRFSFNQRIARILMSYAWNPIVLSSRLRRRLDILQVCKGAGNHPREHILRDILGVHSRFREQPEQRDLSELGELMVPYLPQQAGPFPRVYDLAQGFEPLFDEGVLIEIRRRILGFMSQADRIQGAQGVARGKSRPVDRLGPELFPHPGEVDFHELGLEPYGLPVERQGLPNIHHLRQPWESVEVRGELKPIGIPCLLQKRLGPGRVIAVEFLEAFVPVRIPDPRPDGTVQLGMVPMHPMRCHPTAQEVLSDGLAVDGQVHGLSYCFLHKGDSGIQLVRRGKVHPTKLPLVLDGG